MKNGSINSVKDGSYSENYKWKQEYKSKSIQSKSTNRSKTKCSSIDGPSDWSIESSRDDLSQNEPASNMGISTYRSTLSTIDPWRVRK